MIFKKLVLHNFGIYKGRHEIVLAPPSDDKPIVLFGGLNGGGKTTFLHAIQLALYGKFSSCVSQTSSSYDHVLAEFINKDVNPAEGAAVELHIQHYIDGQEENIEIFRAWKKSGKSISETFEAKQNGLDDPVMADRWYEVVEGLLPSALSSLFFFDGEKIQSLADPAASSQFVKKGIFDLLGLDLVSTLISDLKINERRKLIKEVEDKNISEELESAEKNLNIFLATRESLGLSRAGIKGRLDEILKGEEEIKSKYRAMGGELLEQRESILLERDRLTIELHHIDQQMRDLAGGVAPLLLVRGLLDEVKTQALEEQEIERQRSVLASLKDRDAQLLQKLGELSIAKGMCDEVTKYLGDDRRQRSNLVTKPITLNIPPEELAPFTDSSLDEVEKRIDQLANHRESVQSRKEDQDRLIEGMPDPEGLEGMTSKLSNFESQRIRAEVEQNTVEEEIDKINSVIEKAKTKLDQIQMRNIEISFSSERIGRVLNISKKAREILVAYQKRLSLSHIKKLEDLVLESYKQLLRKKSLVDSIEICPAMFELNLYDESKRLVPPGRLSAGERQLLSVAILWGLAKASGRPIPTIIDTPLGRLDGSHRVKLVKNYFPQAAHQVILLSTDEEISGELYGHLKEHIGHEYMLTFNEESATTEISKGYEFRGAA